MGETTVELNVQNKVAVITGGSKGIGLATATALAREGAKITIVARSEAGLAAAAESIRKVTGQDILTIQGDVSSEADCIRAIEHTVRHYGRLDILVNNAGTAMGRPFPEIDYATWQGDFDLKFYAAVHCTKAAIPHMKRSGGGAVVNVTAIRGKAPSASSTPSSVTRAAGLALTKAMSKDLAKDGIRVNAVCIGSIRSEQIERIWKNKSPELTWEQYSTDPSHDIPLGRFGESEEAANVIAFLVSGAASYVTGVAVNIDGGKSDVL
jgi:3-oxoacyl-[acyl-carrier protein] reductase